MKSLYIILLGLLSSYSCTPSERAIERKERRLEENKLQKQRENSGNFNNNIELKPNNPPTKALIKKKP
jgi:hypothetical protein